MKTPIEMELDKIQWHPLVSSDERDEGSGGLPYATHEGVLKIGDHSLRVYQLSNGQRVINQDDLSELLA